MIIRKLEQSEHIATRKLWEEIFPEDTKAFLDYYYYIKAAKNQIYVVEEDGRICSMLQLNPYRIRLEDKSFPSEYIVAVATKKEYRSRGYMRALLNTVLERMHSEKVPFTFLMPAAEAIYRPYDFRYIYDQCMQEVKKDETSDARNRESEPQKEGTLEFSDAGLWDAEEMADFFEEHFSDSWQVYAQRDTAYYQTMILERQSEKGGVRLMRENGVLKGFYAYALEEGLEVREPLYLNQFEGEFERSMQMLLDKSNIRKVDQNENRVQQSLRIYAPLNKKSCKMRSMIMARIVCLPEFLKAMIVDETETLECSFAVLDSILYKNSCVWKLTSVQGEKEIHVQETEDSQGVFPIADLTEYLFGRIDLEELREREGVICTAELGEELEKIEKLTRVYFNEVV